MTLPSFCLECDAPPQACDHGGTRYLDPIVYTPVADEQGRHVGWNVPDGERERWERPPAFTKAPVRQGREPRPLQRLVVELEAWMFVDRQLEQSVRDAYDREPLRVSLLVEHVAQLAEQGKLDNPAGLLAVKLRELAGESRARANGRGVDADIPL